MYDGENFQYGIDVGYVKSWVEICTWWRVWVRALPKQTRQANEHIWTSKRGICTQMNNALSPMLIFTLYFVCFHVTLLCLSDYITTFLITFNFIFVWFAQLHPLIALMAIHNPLGYKISTTLKINVTNNNFFYLPNK